MLVVLGVVIDSSKSIRVLSRSLKLWPPGGPAVNMSRSDGKVLWGTAYPFLAALERWCRDLEAGGGGAPADSGWAVRDRGSSGEGSPK